MALKLNDLAGAKKLPPDFLAGLDITDGRCGNQDAIRIPYRNETGEIYSVRYRLALGGDDRFRWRTDDHVIPYGLDRLAEMRAVGWILLVEGESDCWTAWHLGLPAIGLPGKATWQPEWAELFNGLNVFLWVEPDAPDLVERVGKTMPEITVINAPHGIKDLSEAHIKGIDLEPWLGDLKAGVEMVPEQPPFALTLADFMAGPTEVPWLWEGIIADPSLGILAAKPKFGKTLLSFNLAIAASQGQSYLGRAVEQCNVLIVQLEDPAVIIRNRLEKMGADGERIFIRAGLPLQKEDWVALRAFIEKNEIGLVIIDPLIFAMRGNEQDATATGAFLREVRELIFATDCSVLLVHHHRKSGGEHGDAIRGSSAILGAVDVALEIVREDVDDPTATLKITSRFACVEPEVLQLDTSTLTWSSRGSVMEYRQTKRQDQILQVLKDEGDADMNTLSKELGLDPSNFRPDLKLLVDEGRVYKYKQRTKGRPKNVYSLKNKSAEKPADNQGIAENITGPDLVEDIQSDLFSENPNPRVSKSAEKPNSDDLEGFTVVDL